MIYVDVRPLLNSEFTGIPQLTWHLAQFWLNRREDGLRFFVGTMEIDRRIVEKLVTSRTGRYVQANPQELRQSSTTISSSEARRSVGIYPHTRAHRNKQFGKEVQVIHDLTGLITPEFHPDELVRGDMQRAINDIPQIDHFICVSRATQDDLCYYYRIDRERTTVSYPGVAWFDSHKESYRFLSTVDFEPYILVLGTFEPRKNIDLVFKYIQENVKIIENFKFVFCGSPGWGGVYDRCVSSPYVKSLLDSGRVKIIPFISERLKFALMKEAAFLIYPSYLEGFGSPVAEALSVGTPVALSYGGSLPEVAGDVGYYFDPDSTADFERAVNRVIFDIEYKNAETRRNAQNQGRKFSWSAFNEGIRTIVEPLEAEMMA